MTLDNLQKTILENLKDKNEEFKRIFHGRGNFYSKFNYLTIDSIDKIFFASFFEEVDEENEIIKLLENIAKENSFSSFVVQRRYTKKVSFEVVFGKIEGEEIATEDGLKYLLNFENKNIGIFPDMKIGREYIKNISENKNVLNLFSYTCAFSVSAIAGNAKKVVNVDMAKGALSTGRKNHYLNKQDTKKVKFLPYNILKSWSRIKKDAPYDIIIIDPPSFQKGSFAATKDYEKIIKRLDQLASEDCIILSCLNAPELGENFIKELFFNLAPSFKFERRLDNLSTFPSLNEQKSLKNLIFNNK